MTFRLFDWYCSICGHVQEMLAWTKRGETPPKTLSDQCPECHEIQTFKRQISLPARYTGEDCYTPSISGGTNDTNGFVQHVRPAQFDLRGTFDQTKPENRDKAETIVQSGEYREWKRERREVQKNNAAKRKRNAAIQNGANINLRRKENQLPGDPVRKLKMGAT